MSARAVVAATVLLCLVAGAVALSAAVPSSWDDGPGVAVSAAVGAAVAAVAFVLAGSARSVLRGVAPVVLLVAVAGAVVTAWGDDSSAGVRALVSAMVVATPCVAGLAAVTASRSGLRRARRLGACYDGVAGLERVAAVDLVLVPAPGILTTGELRVDEVRAIDPDDERTLRWFAGALAHVADDPVARAVRRLATRGVVTDADVRPGEGFSGAVDRHPVRVGRPDWVGVAVPPGPGTSVGVEVDGRALGSLTLRPELVPDVVAHLARLRALGVEARLVPGPSERDDHELAAQLGLARADGADGAATGTSRGTARVVEAPGDGVPRADEVLVSRTTTTGPVSLDLGDGDIGTLAGAVDLARSSRRASVVAERVALVSLAAVPVAALGLLVPVVAAGLTVLVALGVAAYASLEARVPPLTGS